MHMSLYAMLYAVFVENKNDSYKQVFVFILTYLLT